MFLGLETIGKRSGVVESVGYTNSQSKWMDFDYLYIKNKLFSPKAQKEKKKKKDEHFHVIFIELHVFSLDFH